MSTIRLENINKEFSGSLSVVDVNLEVQDGELLVFVGPSGCGKSTTLRMIAGLETATSGNIYIDDKEVTNLSPKDRDLAMVFQDYALYPHLTVKQNLMYPLRMKKVPKSEHESRVNEVARKLNLSELLNRKPRQLSGGQRQRVALGRAIIRQPKAFLMDEPLSNLDAQLRVQMRYEISQLHKQLSATIIYVTHDQVEAMTLSDRIVVMNNGRIQQVGTPEEIYTRPSNIFIAEFIGSPKINLFNAGYRDDRFSLNDPIDFVPSCKISHDQVLVGIRPENLELIEGDNYQVKLLENLGDRKIVHLSSRSNKDYTIVVNEGVNVDEDRHYDLKVVDSSKVLYFDPITQKLIDRGI